MHQESKPNTCSQSSPSIWIVYIFKFPSDLLDSLGKAEAEYETTDDAIWFKGFWKGKETGN